MGSTGEDEIPVITTLVLVNPFNPMQILDNPTAFQTPFSQILTLALLYQDWRRRSHKKTAPEEKLEVEREEKPEHKSFLSTLSKLCFRQKCRTFNIEIELEGFTAERKNGISSQEHQLNNLAVKLSRRV